MIRLNTGKMTCIRQTMDDLGVSMTFKQMNVLLGIAQYQGYTIAALSDTLDLKYAQVHQIIERLGAGGSYRNGYQIRGLRLVKKVKYNSRGKRRKQYMYLTPKGITFVKRITRNKR